MRSEGRRKAVEGKTVLCSLILVGLPYAFNNSIKARGYSRRDFSGPLLHVMQNVLKAVRPKVSSIALE